MNWYKTSYLSSEKLSLTRGTRATRQQKDSGSSHHCATNRPSTLNPDKVKQYNPGPPPHPLATAARFTPETPRHNCASIAATTLPADKATRARLLKDSEQKIAVLLQQHQPRLKPSRLNCGHHIVPPGKARFTTASSTSAMHADRATAPPIVGATIVVLLVRHAPHLETLKPQIAATTLHAARQGLVTTAAAATAAASSTSPAINAAVCSGLVAAAMIVVVPRPRPRARGAAQVTAGRPTP